MVLFYLAQVPAQWFTEAGNAALAGGVLRFYAVGTSTPKAVFSDYQGVTAAGTAVTLNASGRANVFLDGLYSVTLEDSEGVQIGAKVDGIGNAAMIGDGSTLVIETYDDLRQFDGTDFRACVVQGRTANGDGGSGLFVWDALETTADDGGAILAPLTLPLSGRWVRVRGDTLDPRWYGCRIDGTTADDTQLALALAASVTLKARLHFEGGYSRVTSNTAIPTGARVSCGEAAGLTATSSTVTLTVPAGAIFTGSAACFGGMLQPLFSGIDTPLIPLSWMGGASVDSMLDKWAAASGIAGQTYLLDKTVAGIIPAFLAGRHLDVVPGCFHTVNATAQSLDVDVIVPSATHWMSWGAIANIGSVNVGKRPCRAEWFGAVGNATADDSLPMFAAMLTGSVELRPDGRYLIDDDISLDGDLRVVGSLESAMDWSWTFSSQPSSLPSPALLLTDGTSEILQTGSSKTWTFKGCSIALASGNLLGNVNTGSMTFDGCALWCEDDEQFKSDYVTARDCSIAYPGIFFAAADDQQLSNVKSAGLTRTNFRDNTSLRNAYVEADLYLDDNKNATNYDAVATTDADGLVKVKTSLVLEHVTIDGVQDFNETEGCKFVSTFPYTVLDSDPQIIVFTPSGVDEVILNASAGATHNRRTFINSVTDSEKQIYFTGDVVFGGSFPSIAFAGRVREGYYFSTLGKWAL